MGEFRKGAAALALVVLFSVNAKAIMGGLRPPILQKDNPIEDIVSRRYFEDFYSITAHLNSLVESQTDVFYFVNTSETPIRSNFAGLIVPPQHLMMVLRLSHDQPVFLRDAHQRVVGLNPAGAQVVGLALNNRGQINYHETPAGLQANANPAGYSPFVPVSSGTYGKGKIQTYSGIFRIDEAQTNAKRRSTNTTHDPMQNSVYIDARYDDGPQARLALHGTREDYWPLLGVRRASSGCIRLQSQFSRWNQSFLFTSESRDGSLVPRSRIAGNVSQWSNRLQTPPDADTLARSPSAYRLRALAIFFDGY